MLFILPSVPSGFLILSLIRMTLTPSPNNPVGGFLQLTFCCSMSSTYGTEMLGVTRYKVVLDAMGQEENTRGLSVSRLLGRSAQASGTP